MKTIQNILEQYGYSSNGIDNRNRAVRSINSVLKNTKISIELNKPGYVWKTQTGFKYNLKISLEGVKSVGYYTNIEPYFILINLAKFLTQNEVINHIKSDIQTPHKCSKCEGTGFIEGFMHYANGVCFDCMGIGKVGKLSVAITKELTGSRYVKQFYVSAEYDTVFPAGLTKIKALRFVGHPTAEEWLSCDDVNYYIHQPICKGNSGYVIPVEEFEKFKKYYII